MIENTPLNDLMSHFVQELYSLQVYDTLVYHNVYQQTALSAGDQR